MCSEINSIHVKIYRLLYSENGLPRHRDMGTGSYNVWHLQPWNQVHPVRINDEQIIWLQIFNATQSEAMGIAQPVDEFWWSLKILQRPQAPSAADNNHNNMIFYNYVNFSQYNSLIACSKQQGMQITKKPSYLHIKLWKFHYSFFQVYDKGAMVANKHHLHQINLVTHQLLVSIL